LKTIFGKRASQAAICQNCTTVLESGFQSPRRTILFRALGEPRFRPRPCSSPREHNILAQYFGSTFKVFRASRSNALHERYFLKGWSAVGNGDLAGKNTSPPHNWIRLHAQLSWPIFAVRIYYAHIGRPRFTVVGPGFIPSRGRVWFIPTRGGLPGGPHSVSSFSFQALITAYLH
jgi:hypothetical protein